MNSITLGIYLKQKAKSVYKEIFRKSIHICSAFVPTLLGIAYYPVIVLLCLALVFYVISEFLRLRGINIPLISKITETAARKRDEKKIVMGPITLVIGILIAALVLPSQPARIGIYALSFGDGTASLVGKLIGRITIPGSGGKTVAGSLSCFLSVYISCFIVSGNCLISLLCALSAMLIEVLPLADMDNILIPISIGSIFLGLSNILI